MDHLDVINAFRNPEIDNDDIYMTLPEGWLKGLTAPNIIVRLRKAPHSLQQASWLWHNNIHPFLLSRGFTQSSADPNLYLHSDGSLILHYLDDISTSYLEAATKVAIEVCAKLSEKYTIMHLGLACQLFHIEI